MLNDVTLGQFFPGDSLLHKADPRAKLILTVFYIVTLFMADNIFAFALLFAFSLVMIFISRISISVILKGFKPIIFILIFIILNNSFRHKIMLV